MKNTWKNVASIDNKQTEDPKGEQNRFSFLLSLALYMYVDSLYTEVYTVDTSSTVSSLIHTQPHPSPTSPSLLPLCSPPFDKKRF